MEFPFTVPLKVRDYECDMQGIVNNSVYQNYLEHARHEYLLSENVDFAALAKLGVNLVVTRVELDYKAPLSSGDEFWVGVRPQRLGRIRFEFLQNIYRSRDDALILSGRVVGVALNPNGRPYFPADLATLFASEG